MKFPEKLKVPALIFAIFALFMVIVGIQVSDAFVDVLFWCWVVFAVLLVLGLFILWCISDGNPWDSRPVDKR